ncbi:MAG: nucleoside hydrolase [Alphaproteobacteria bacterium]|nr:nucleoside hydrolase [Alphaproteobacteria bacterium]
MTTGLLIDTDPALGLPLSDVDDAIAIHFAVRAGLPVAGLTTCFGNAPGPDTYAVARDLGERFGLPVFRGADAPGQVENDAVDALLAHTGTVLALAPMTNIAAALLRGARWERLVVLGGTNRTLPNLRPLHTTEFNLAMDPAAATVALERTDVLFPMDVCRQVWLDADDVARLPAWMADRCAHWLQLAPLLTGRPAFHPWDLLPAVWLRFPSLFTTTRARPVPRFLPLYRGYVRYEPGQAEVAIHVDAERLVRFWAETISPE